MPSGSSVLYKAGKNEARIIHRRHRGFTLVEAVFATLIVGGLFAVALNAVSASRSSQQRAAEQGRGMLLAQDLMAEILRQEYEDPDDLLVVLGIEVSELLSTGRTAFDDVDDYDKWRASPPEYRDGSAIPNANGFRREVRVKQTKPDKPDAGSGQDLGVKRVEVTVEYRGREVAQLFALRTAAWEDPIPQPPPSLGDGSGGGSSGGGSGDGDGDGDDPDNTPPTAVADADPLSYKGNPPVKFDATGSSDPDGDALTFTWDFGDGSTATGPTPQHRFKKGRHTVTLTVDDGRGGTDTDTLKVHRK